MDDLPLIDRAHLDSQTFGDAALADELLGLFAEQCRTLLPQIADAARTLSERADLAHTLKGSALGIGAKRVAQHAADLEDGFRAGHGAPTAVEPLAEAVADTLAHL